MRTPADLPRTRRRRTGRGRIWLVAAVVLIIVGLTSLRGIAGFYTTYLWFESLGLTSVWRGVLGMKILLVLGFSAAFFVLLVSNLIIADRLAPRFRTIGPEDELVQRYRQAVGRHAGKVRIAVAALFALLAGTGTSSQWHNWLLFRNAVDFGVEDPQFGKDVSYYVFTLPFLSFLVNWLFVGFVIISVVTVVAHYLNGGIRLQAAGQRVSPYVKAHISVLLGVLAIIKAVGYYLQRYELNFSTRGAVHGATYTDVKAQLPAIELLIFISLAAAVLFLANIRRQGWVLPIIGVGLWAFISVIVGAVYPAFIQQFRVEPSEIQRERPYIVRNIAATRRAMGLDVVKTAQFDYKEDLTAGVLAENSETIRNVRLWDPTFVQQTYQRMQEIRQYYRFNDVDVDRYRLDGRMTQTIVSARELNLDDLPSKSWVNQHLAFTHGYGAVVSASNAVTADGRPDFLVRNVPVEGAIPIKEPRLYFGENIGGYSIVHTDQKEIDFQTREGQTERSTYAGRGGVKMGSLLRRMAFALRFGEPNPLISGLVNKGSRAIYIRDIRDRVRTAAPFLKYDHDPYPVIIDGRIFWIQDAYTTTSRYPAAQRVATDDLDPSSGLRTSFNYVRNSVKVVIDAYHGDMTFYLVDEKDPIARAYQKAFPKMFTSKSKIPDELREHFRYPEDLFEVQTSMYGRYHITDAVEFYGATDAWNVSPDPGSGRISSEGQTITVVDAQGRVVSRRTARMDATYLLLRLPGEDRESFLILRPFVAASGGGKQQNLTGFMTAKSDPDSYGVLQVFEMPRGQQIDGPALIDARAKQDEEIARQITLLDQRGSQVLQGNLLTIPIMNSILYIRPLYVQSESRATALPELRKVIVVYGNQGAEMANTLQEALARLFGSAPPTLERPKEGGEAPPPGAVVPTSVQQMLDEAQSAYDAALAALRDGNLAEYEKQVKRMGDLIRRAREASTAATAGGGRSGTTTTTAPKSA